MKEPKRKRASKKSKRENMNNTWLDTWNVRIKNMLKEPKQWAHMKAKCHCCLTREKNCLLAHTSNILFQAIINTPNSVHNFINHQKLAMGSQDYTHSHTQCLQGASVPRSRRFVHHCAKKKHTHKCLILKSEICCASPW